MRKFLLILCIAFVVVCYGFPCIMLPLGEYKYTNKEFDIEITYEFKFNGKVCADMSGEKEELYYKLKGNKIVLCQNDKFEKGETISLKLESFYEISVEGLAKATNKIAQWITVGVGVAALALVLTMPKKKS